MIGKGEDDIVTVGHADPERAARYAEAGVVDHRWRVAVGDQEVGLGGERSCRALAEELRGDPEKARKVREFMRDLDARKSKGLRGKKDPNVEYPAGWVWPDNSRKAHFFPTGETRSLCCKWLFAGFPFQRSDSSHKSPDNCAKCQRARTLA